jgi:phosphohistidine swiveling domain-containing protein
MRVNNEWNTSLSGDYLWSNVNFGEAVTETMTPLTWSVIQYTLDDWRFLPGYPTVGNIGGTPYLNISIFATLFKAMGRSREDLLQYMEGTLYMELPDEMEIPLIQLSPMEAFKGLFAASRVQMRQRKGIRELPSYLAETPAWFQQMRTRLEVETQKAALRSLWQDKINPHIKKGVWCVLGSVTHSSDYTLKLRRELTKLVGPDDANLLIANLSEREDLLASLGLVAGLTKLARGEIAPEAYLEQYGHRGPHEFELSVPRPVENPTWLNGQLQHFREHPVDIDDLVAKQQAAFQTAWDRLQSQYHHQANAINKRIRENARRARLRELARSEYTRDRWLIRLFALRVAELTGLGEDVFFLNLAEMLNLLSGDQTALKRIPTRKETYHQYKALPSYPSVIRGRFDPIKWAADPQRRSDIFDATAIYQPDPSNIIKGSPGSAGQVTGTVRIAASPEEGQQLQPGEILVAVQTDVAWTLLFPHATAVITDVGAPLSHVAIVARELGIPAVVGCGDATTRLKNGDRVRVDGARGTVEILAPR